MKNKEWKNALLRQDSKQWIIRYSSRPKNDETSVNSCRAKCVESSKFKLNQEVYYFKVTMEK